jgi:hypothetical protein
MQFVGQTGVFASDQQSIFENTTLQHLPGGQLAMSIAVAITISEEVIVGGEWKIVEYVKELMAPLPDTVSIERWVGRDDVKSSAVRSDPDDPDALPF